MQINNFHMVRLFDQTRRSETAVHDSKKIAKLT